MLPRVDDRTGAIDITKDAQQASTEFDWDSVAPRLPGYRPDLRALPSEYQNALSLINSAKRPVILAGHGMVQSGAMKVLRFCRRRRKLRWR